MAGIDHFEVSLDNTTWINVGLNMSYTFTGVSDGEHTVYVKAVDIAGYERYDSVSILVDTAFPTASLGLPVGVQTGVFTINISVDDANFESAVLYIDGAPVFTTTLPGSYTLTLNASSFADGNHTVQLVVRDKAGKETSVSGTLSTGFYEAHEEESVSEAVGRERSAATTNMALTGVGGLVVGAIVGALAIGRIARPRE